MCGTAHLPLQRLLESQTLFGPIANLLAGLAILAFLLVSYGLDRRKGKEISAMEKVELAVGLVFDGLWTLFALAGFLGTVCGIESLQTFFRPGSDGSLYDAGLLAALSAIRFFLLFRRERAKKREEGRISKWGRTKLAASGFFAALFLIVMGVYLMDLLTGAGALADKLLGLEACLLAAAGLFIWISSLVRLLYVRQKGEDAPVHLYLFGIGPLVVLGFILLMAGFVWLPRLLEPGA